ncbi:MAG: ornithine carbamoyltransferase [Verrucomicrobiota bacterium]|nr:ornithine carbamoyltransferase [Verrucomicrobiota bacterium]
MKHLLSLEKLARGDMETILQNTAVLKSQRGDTQHKPLAGQTWALIFTKSSTRTRVSFEVGVRELGGSVMFLSSADIQLGRGEPIKDTARVLGRMIHGAIIRTFAQSNVEEFAEFAKIPTINALTDDEHPCQVLADIFTFQEKRGSIAGKIVTFIGDGACNMANSWIFAAAKLGFELRIAAPKNFQPSADILSRSGADFFSGMGEEKTAHLKKSGGKVVVTDDLESAATDADLLYTDVWISMGKEAESTERIQQLSGCQINEALVKLAKPDALVMHCLPAYRGKEITGETFEKNALTIFDEAENRLHTQKAILSWIVG